MKTKVISIIIIAILLIGFGTGYYIYQDNEKQKEINEKLNEISKSEKAFSNAENRETKFDILKSTFEQMEEYETSSAKYEEISNKYTDVISNMQTIFKEEYNNSIKDNTIDDLDNSEDITIITTYTENLDFLLSTIESEKDYTLSNDSEYSEYANKISNLTEAYSNRITAIETKQAEDAKKMAEEEARKKAEKEKAKTHYENEYFSVDVPESWIDCWSVTENSSSDGNTYNFVYEADSTYGGGATIYVVDATYGLPQNGSVIDTGCELVGYTSNKFGIFRIEAGAGFFSAGATITLK